MNKLSVQTEVRESIVIVSAVGRIDSETSPMFDSELSKAIGGNAKIIVDLKEVDYMSSAGIRAIMKASQAAEKNGGTVKLACVPESINSILYTVGLNQKINSYTTVNEAIGSY